MKVALIGLATKRDHAFLNLGALQIAAAIRDGGHEVKFIDLVRYPLVDKEVEERVGDFGPDLIAYSGIITTYYQLETLSKQLKTAFPDVPQLVGGSLGSSGHKIIEKHTDVDLICIGEGEETILLLLEKLRTDKRWEEIPNIYYREGSELKTTRSSSTPPDGENLDSLLFPAYDLVDIEYYIEYASITMDREKAMDGTLRALPMVFSRS